MTKKKFRYIVRLIAIVAAAILSLPFVLCGLICYAAIDVFLLPVSSMALIFAVTCYLGLPTEYAYIPALTVGYIVSFKPLMERLKPISLK